MATMRDLASVLAAQAPRDQAAKVLDLLIARARATAGAVLALRNGEVVVFVTSRDLAASQIGGATEMWTSLRRRLQGGDPVASGGNVLAPVRDAHMVAALVYLVAPQSFDPVSVETFAGALLKAVQFDSTASAEGPLESWLDRPEGERERLTAILNRNEGNIARVARLLGVTRRTIYLRMQRFGVPRIKMPRTNSPRRPKVSPA